MMKKFLLLVALVFSFAFDANAVDEKTEDVICGIVKYTQGLGGPMITIVIIGAALLAIFGRMPWPELFALGAFTAVFFGAPAVLKAIAPQGLTVITARLFALTVARLMQQQVNVHKYCRLQKKFQVNGARRIIYLNLIKAE